MKGYSKTSQPIGRVAELLTELRRRAGLTQRQIAAKIGRSYQPVHMAESYPGGVSADIVYEIAIACGATSEETGRLRVLLMMDAKAVPLPRDVTEEQLRKVLEILDQPTHACTFFRCGSSMGEVHLERCACGNIRPICINNKL